MPDLYRDAGITVARMCGESLAMDAYAHEMQALVVGAAEPHSKTEHFVSSIHVESVLGERGVRDRAVASSDHGALPIEFGHWQGDTWVEGIHPFARAMAAVR